MKPNLNEFFIAMNTAKCRNSRCDSLEQVVGLLRDAWAGRLPHLTYFLLSKTKKHRILSLTIGGLPPIAYQANETTRSVQLIMNWNSKSLDDKPKKTDWSQIKPDPKSWEKPKNQILITTNMTFHLQKITGVYAYDWGYEFRTKGPLDIVAALKSCVSSHPDVSDAFNEDLGSAWDIPFKTGQYADPKRMIPVFFWDIFGEAVDIADLLEEPESKPPDYGHRRVGLDFE